MPTTPRPGRRYYFENPSYSYSDGIFLHCMLRHLRPQRLIEAGSGFTSALTLDTNEFWLDRRLQCTFIEPYPQLLRSLLKTEDFASVQIISSPLQEVPLGAFASLQANDVLFIDSTHVSKIDSDVNYLFFEILPLLQPGVYVHFHDIFYPFRYPESWILEGRGWNEAYLLRAFLQFNSDFEIVLFNTFLETCHRDWFEKNMPLCLKDPGGSIWLRRKRVCP